MRTYLCVQGLVQVLNLCLALSFCEKCINININTFTPTGANVQLQAVFGLMLNLKIRTRLATPTSQTNQRVEASNNSNEFDGKDAEIIGGFGQSRKSSEVLPWTWSEEGQENRWTWTDEEELKNAAIIQFTRALGPRYFGSVNRASVLTSTYLDSAPHVNFSGLTLYLQSMLGQIETALSQSLDFGTELESDDVWESLFDRLELGKNAIAILQDGENIDSRIDDTILRLVDTSGFKMEGTSKRIRPGQSMIQHLVQLAKKQEPYAKPNDDKVSKLKQYLVVLVQYIGSVSKVDIKIASFDDLTEENISAIQNSLIPNSCMRAAASWFYTNRIPVMCCSMAAVGAVAYAGLGGSK